MKAENLLVSAAINIGFAALILALFSILKKKPSNAPIYFARRISLDQMDTMDQRFTFRRLIPSLDWIYRAVQVTEEEILEQCGLDVLILIRLLKFGINFFLICCVVGLLILLPLNYTANERHSTEPQSLDSFTISNIKNGSNRLWVHLSCLYFVSCYALYLLYKEYKDIWLKRAQQLCHIRDRPDQFTVLVREIPICFEHKAHGCSVDHFFSKCYPNSYQSYQILYDSKELERLLALPISSVCLLNWIKWKEYKPSERVKAKTIKEKIEHLRQASMTNKAHKRSPLLKAWSMDEKLQKLEKMLQQVSAKIQKVRFAKMIEQKELPVAFVMFRSRWGATLAAQSQQHANPLLWTTEVAPEPGDVLWRNLTVPYRRLPVYKIVMFVAASVFTIFFAIPVTAIQGISKFERLQKWFPPAMAVQLIPGVRSIVTGYLPSAILNAFIYVVPFCMIAMAKLAGYISRSKRDIKACDMVFYFLVGNVFFLSLLSGSLFDQINDYFGHPKDFPSHLAKAVTAQGDFFTTYILTNGLSGFSLEILQPALLIWDLLKSHLWYHGKHKVPYLYSLPYYRIVPFVALLILIGMVYAVVSPLLLPFLVGYFLLGYIVYINQVQQVYVTTYETCGQYWPCIHKYILLAIILMQITMIGLFGLKSKPSASVCTIPLLVFTFVFNEYCKMRFLPAFSKFAVKDAKENDEIDERNEQRECKLQRIKDAYCPPCLLSPEVEGEGSSSPLLC